MQTFHARNAKKAEAVIIDRPIEYFERLVKRQGYCAIVKANKIVTGKLIKLDKENATLLIKGKEVVVAANTLKAI